VTFSLTPSPFEDFISLKQKAPPGLEPGQGVCRSMDQAIESIE
jgi:hypothetical protein